MSGSLARKHDGLMARTVREVLGTVFAPDVRDRVFEEALDRGQASTVPEEAERARDFVEGPLREVLLDYSGQVEADAVQDGLDPILEMAGSHVRARRRDDEDDTNVTTHRSDRSTIPGPPPDPADVAAAGLSPVLMATLDRTGVDGVARCLVGRAHVRQINDVFELMASLDEHASAGPTLVIDCCLPAVDPTTVATMLPVVPPGTHVILWGATERMRADLETLVPAARAWIVCPADATHEDLSKLLETFC